MAKEWFDMSSGEVNTSWNIFKKKITDRFQRRVLTSVTRRKMEARRWLYFKETFQKYAMNKLAIMRCLKLSEEELIQEFINGIGSYALRTTAASLKVQSLNQFLREMHHIPSASGEPHRKSPTFKQKFDKFKDKDIHEQQEEKTSQKNDLHIKRKMELFCTY